MAPRFGSAEASLFAMPSLLLNGRRSLRHQAWRLWHGSQGVTSPAMASMQRPVDIVPAIAAALLPGLMAGAAHDLWA